MDRQREQAVEVLLAMEGQCRELVIDCRQGMLGKQGCQVTVLRREHILSLLQELNRLYDSGIPRRELNDDKEEDDENCCFSLIYEFDFFLQESGFLLHFVIDAALDSDGVIKKYLTLERQVHREGAYLKVSEPMVLDPDALVQLKRKVAAIMTVPPNTERFLDWKDIYPGLDE